MIRLGNIWFRGNFVQTIDILLSDSTKALAQAQVDAGRFNSVSEYVSALIEEDLTLQDQAKLEAMLVEGLESGPATPWTREDLVEIRAEAMRQYEARKALKTV